MRKRQRDLPGGVLASECEAFLNGTLAEYWEERGTAVPVWTWTNLLAHGSESQITDSVHRPSKPRRTGRSWRIARSYLAYEVLELTREDFTLEELQSTVLSRSSSSWRRTPRSTAGRRVAGSTRWTTRSATSTRRSAL